MFEKFSLGVVTNRDAWCYNASKRGVTANMGRMIDFYNSQVADFNKANPGVHKNDRATLVEGFICTDATKISWTRSLKQELVKDHQFELDVACLAQGMYRPFTKQWMYFNRRFNEMVYQVPQLFPNKEAKNIVIGVSASESRNAFSVFITDCVPSLHAVDMVGSQYFPLYLYDKSGSADDQVGASAGLFEPEVETGQPPRRDAITDEGLAHFRDAYAGEAISKEDLFYYVYGLLHSPDYRERYADNLGKELPRIPRVRTAADFRAFSRAGRALAALHLGYETVPMYAGANIDTGGKTLTDADYRVEKMKIGKRGKDKDLTTLHYNSRITVTGIPPEAYDYVVNGKPALDWVIERQCVKPDKNSGIVNDANDWATETMGNARYPLELFLRVVTVSLETMKLVASLPKLEILEEAAPAQAAGHVADAVPA